VRRKESKNSIGQTGNGTCVFWRCEAVCCGTGWLDFIEARRWYLLVVLGLGSLLL